MAIRYVWSGASSPTSPYLDSQGWNQAAPTIEAAVSVSSAGDQIFVHVGATTPHSYKQTGSYTITGPSSNAPIYVIGVDKDNSNAYAVATTVTEDTTIDLTLDGAIEFYGIDFSADDDITIRIGDGDEYSILVQDCKFKIGTASGRQIIISSVHPITFINCEFQSEIFLGRDTFMTFIDCIVETGQRNDISNATFVGCDFSTSAESSKFTSASNIWYQNNYIGCKFHSGGFLHNGADGARHKFYDCFNDGGSGTLGSFKADKNDCGDLEKITTVYRDNSEVEWSFLFDCTTDNFVVEGEWNSVYIGTTGSKTIEVEIANASAKTFQDDELYLEFEYYPNSGDTLKTVLTTRPGATTSIPYGNPVATPTNLNSSAETWTGITETAQTISLTVTVNQVGLARWRIVSRTATAFYVDPDIQIT